VEEIQRLSGRVAERLRRHGRPARTITLKLRRADFTTVTRSRTLPAPTDNAEVICATATALFDGEWRPGEPVRLLGVRASNLIEAAGYQLPLIQCPHSNPQ
jgi:DNA polymerase-4